MCQENYENEYVDAEDANEEHDEVALFLSQWESAQDEILERQELEDFEQCDEYFGDHPFDASCYDEGY